MYKSAIEIVKHIYIETKFVLANTKGVSSEEFNNNETLKRAIVRSLEIIGEASKKLDEEFKLKNSQIEWKSMAQMRNKLIHDYFGVDYDIVWDVVTSKIEELNHQVELLIKENS